jgi:trehalose 6-phosphate synthase
MSITEAMERALSMPLGERQERWRAMMATLRRNDLTIWRRRFIDRLAAATVAA